MPFKCILDPLYTLLNFNSSCNNDNSAIGLGVHTTDLPQGNTQANIKRHNALRGCRFCYVESNEWNNLNLDMIAYGRYEQLTLRQLKHLHSLESNSEKQQFARDHGLATRLTQPFSDILFDRHVQIPVDPAHCICQGLDAVLIEATLSAFSPAGKEKFVTILNNMILPRGWTRFKDPITHLRSYFFSDYARLIMVGTFIIQQFEESDFSAKVLSSMRQRIGIRSNAQVLDEILLCWTTLASTSTMIFASEVKSYDALSSAITELANQLLKVCVPILFLLLGDFCEN